MNPSSEPSKEPRTIGELSDFISANINPGEVQRAVAAIKRELTNVKLTATGGVAGEFKTKCGYKYKAKFAGRSQ